MTSPELLDALDRRARTAIAALDDTLADTTPPPFSPDHRNPERPQRRGWAALVVAAALAVIALVTAGVLFAAEDEQSTIAGETDPAGPAGTIITDARAAGVTLTGAAWGTSDRADDVPDATVHVPDNGDWDQAVVSTSDPNSTDEWFTGQVVDVGGRDAVITTLPDGIPRVQWREAGTTWSLTGPGHTTAELVALAQDAFDDGWDGTGPLPGHRAVLTAPGPHLWPGVSPGTSPVGSFLAAYRTDEAIAFVTRTQPGGETLWRSLAALAARTETRTVAGRQVLVATFSSGTDPLQVVSWRDEGRVVQVATFGNVDALLERILPHLGTVERRSELDALDAAHAPEEDRAMFAPPSATADLLWAETMDPEGPWPPAGQDALAAVEARTDGYQARAAVLAHNDRFLVAFNSQEQTEAGDGASGAHGIDVPTPDVWFLWKGGSRTEHGDRVTLTQRIVGGLVPAGSRIVAVREVASGTDVPVLDADADAVPGFDAQLVLVVLPPDPAFPSLHVTVRHSDGTERTYRA